MRIVHVYKDYFPVWGGIENHIQSLAEAQAAEGHSVLVLVTNPGNQLSSEELNGVQVLRARRLLTVASTPVSFELPRLLAQTKPDIVHLHFPYPIGEVSQLLFRRQWKYVITYHSDVVNPRQQIFFWVYQPLLYRILAGAAAILATSPNYQATSRHLQKFSHRCRVVPLGIDPQPFLTSESFRRPDVLPTLLFVGKLRYYKGLDILLNAMKEVEARLVVIGDGPMRGRWEKMAKELELEPRVCFHGEVAHKELPSMYASADVFVLPSTVRSEAFGLVLLEAMAAGLPCVATELGTGTSYVVQHGVTGLVVPPSQPRALAEALNRLLSDETLRQEMGMAGRQRVLSSFTLTQMVRAVELVYRGSLEV
ncbi:MAG: glycosyltransferase [Chloroflexota bacterium]